MTDRAGTYYGGNVSGVYDCNLMLTVSPQLRRGRWLFTPIGFAEGVLSSSIEFADSQVVCVHEGHRNTLIPYYNNLKKCNHPNVIQAKALVDSKIPAMKLLALESVDGTLQEYVEALGANLFNDNNEGIHDISQQFKLIIQHCVRGLAYLHSKGLCHGHLTLENTFVVDGVEPTIKLANMKSTKQLVNQELDRRQAEDWISFGKQIARILRITGLRLDNDHEIHDLIEGLLSGRIKGAETVIIHPALWEPATRLDYVKSFYQRCQNIDDVVTSQAKSLLEMNVGQNWGDKIDDLEKPELTQYSQKYSRSSGLDFLRMIMNIYIHILDCSKEQDAQNVRVCLGGSLTSADQIIRQLYPRMIIDLIAITTLGSLEY